MIYIDKNLNHKECKSSLNKWTFIGFVICYITPTCRLDVNV